jgi:hypothetical protein
MTEGVKSASLDFHKWTKISVRMHFSSYLSVGQSLSYFPSPLIVVTNILPDLNCASFFTGWHSALAL